MNDLLKLLFQFSKITALVYRKLGNMVKCLIVILLIMAAATKVMVQDCKPKMLRG